jgi:hypothetical protein
MREEIRVGITRLDTGLIAVKERVDTTNGSVGRHEGALAKSGERLLLLEESHKNTTSTLSATVEKLTKTETKIRDLEVARKTEAQVKRLSKTKWISAVSLMGVLAGVVMKAVDLFVKTWNR